MCGRDRHNNNQATWQHLSDFAFHSYIVMVISIYRTVSQSSLFRNYDYDDDDHVDDDDDDGDRYNDCRPVSAAVEFLLL